MPNYQWPPDSFQARALYASRERKDEERRREEERQIQAQRAREMRFAGLMQAVFQHDWPRVQDQHNQQRLRDFDTRPFTELRYQELTFALVDVEGQHDPVLAVLAQCSTCGQRFAHRPVKDHADAGDVLAQLRDHPDCVHPEMRTAAERQQRLARHALNL